MQNVDYATQDAADQDLFSSPVKGFQGNHRKGEASDTDFQAQGGDSDENESEGEEVTFNLKEEVLQTTLPDSSPSQKIVLKPSPPTVSQPTVKGKRDHSVPQVSSMVNIPLSTTLQTSQGPQWPSTTLQR